MDGITLLTPTGDRPEAFALCERWISRQTYRGPVQWLVIDDGQCPTRTTRGQEYIRREPQPNDPPHTLCMNIRRLVARVRFDKILVIEDDDYYGPRYLETMSRWLDDADLVAEVGAKYYYLDGRTYHVFREHQHGSLCRTGFTRSVLPTVLQQAQTDDWRLDLRLWTAWKGSRYRFIDDRGDARLCVGIKGMPGRRGITWDSRRVIQPDPELRQLRNWIGEDYRYYLPYLGYVRIGELSSVRSRVVPSKDPAADAARLAASNIVVYTAIFGDYDAPQIPAVVNPHVSYILFGDRPYPKAELGPWELRVQEPLEGDPRLGNRYIKIVAHRWFPRTDYTLYLDGNLQLRCDPVELIRLCEERDSRLGRPDEARLFGLAHHQRRCVYEEVRTVARLRLASRPTVRRQLARYRAQRYPKNNGLIWGGFLLRKRGCDRFNELWWQEVLRHSRRDQISLPYALWKTQLPHAVLDVPIPFGRNHCPFVKRTDHRKARFQC